MIDSCCPGAVDWTKEYERLNVKSCSGSSVEEYIPVREGVCKTCGREWADNGGAVYPVRMFPEDHKEDDVDGDAGE